MGTETDDDVRGFDVTVAHATRDVWLPCAITEAGLFGLASWGIGDLEPVIGRRQANILVARLIDDGLNVQYAR